MLVRLLRRDESWWDVISIPFSRQSYLLSSPRNVYPKLINPYDLVSTPEMRRTTNISYMNATRPLEITIISHELWNSTDWLELYIYIFFFWLLFRLSEFQNYKHNNWVSIYEIRLCTIIIMCPTQFISPHNIYTHRIYMYIIIIEAKKNNSIVDCFSQQDLCSNDLFFIEKSHRIFSKLTHI